MSRHTRPHPTPRPNPHPGGGDETPTPPRNGPEEEPGGNGTQEPRNRARAGGGDGGTGDEGGGEGHPGSGDGGTGEPRNRRGGDDGAGNGGDGNGGDGGNPGDEGGQGRGNGDAGGGVTIDVGGVTIGGEGEGEGGGGEDAGDEKRWERIDGTPDDGGAGWNGGGTPLAPGQVGSEGLYPAIPAQGGGANGRTSGDPADFEATESRLDQAARDFETAGNRLADLGRRLSDCLSNDSLTSPAAGPGEEISDKLHEISGKLASGLATTGRRLGDQGRSLRQAEQSATDRFNGLDERPQNVVKPPSPASGGSGGSGGGPSGAGSGSSPQTPTSPHTGGGGGSVPDGTRLDSANPLVTQAPASPALGGSVPDGTRLDSANPLITQAPASPLSPTAGGTAVGGTAVGGTAVGGGTPTVPPQATGPLVHADPGAGAGLPGGADPAAPEQPTRPLTAGSGLEVGLRAEARTLGLSATDTDRVVATLEASPHGEHAAETIASGRYDHRPGFAATVSMLAAPATAPTALHHLDLAARMSDHGVDDLTFASHEGLKDGTRADTGLVARDQDGRSYAYRYKELGDPSQLVRTAQKELWQTVNSGADHQVLWLRTTGSADDLQANGTVRQLTELYSRQRAQFVVETDTGRVGIPAGGRFFPWKEEIR